MGLIGLAESIEAAIKEEQAKQQNLAAIRANNLAKQKQVQAFRDLVRIGLLVRSTDWPDRIAASKMAMRVWDEAGMVESIEGSASPLEAADAFLDIHWTLAALAQKDPVPTAEMITAPWEPIG